MPDLDKSDAQAVADVDKPHRPDTEIVTADQIALLQPDQFTREMWGPYRQALPDPTKPTRFNRLMHEAGSQGMRHVEALVYVVEQEFYEPVAG